MSVNVSECVTELVSV